MKNIIKESGIRDITKLKKDFDDVVIVTHQDSDGVISALGMKNYFQNQGFNVIDAQIIQYGDKEWSLKKSDPNKRILFCLCDFAHGKPMFKIHLDHHDSQAGVEAGTSTNFRQARSNAETISQVVSPRDIFPNDDILAVSTVDSANFAVNEITPEQVMNYLFTFDKDKSVSRNKLLMGLVVNKLLLAFKNKPGFLERIIMECTPSLINVLLKIREIVKEKGYADVQTLEKNKEKYVQDMKSHPNVKVMGNIIVQYGGGNMMKPGSYDRYTPFRNNPEADFLVIAWPMGLVQATCNPFKKERSMKGINLGELAKEVLSKWEGQLKQKEIPLSTIKWVSEMSATPESVGFTFRDFVAIYGNKFKSMNNGREFLTIIGDIMNKPYSSLSEKQKAILEKITISAWDAITANSGGHKCITNISNQYVGRSTQKPQGRGGNSGEDSPLVKFTKMVQNEFVRVLQEKIDNEK